MEKYLLVNCSGKINSIVVFIFFQFMAIYDYDARQLSPHKNKTEELSFKTGDVVICYGNSREDGYYFGKVSVFCCCYKSYSI